jgi:hypothetical protein
VFGLLVSNRRGAAIAQIFARQRCIGYGTPVPRQIAPGYGQK